MINHQMCILVIDDEPEMLKMLQVMLSAEDFEVLTAENARSGLRKAYQSHPDAILLDIMMPDMDGFEACSRLRELTDAPIIFITARGTIQDIVRGFSLGADDYVVKPFDSAELLSRLTASLRRIGSGREEESEALVLLTDALKLDCDRHELVIHNRVVHLTPTEFELLRLLLRNPGKVFSPNTILRRVWGPQWAGERDLVKQYIYRLRQKIEPDPGTPQYLRTIRGSGYYFEPENLL